MQFNNIYYKTEISIMNKSIKTSLFLSLFLSLPMLLDFRFYLDST